MQRREQGVRGREDGAGRERARLRAVGRGRVRAQAAVQRSAPDVRRPRERAEGHARRAPDTGHGRQWQKVGDRAARPIIIIKRVKKVARRPSRRRLESRVRGLRDRDDGVLPRDVAGHGRVERPARGDLRLLQESQHGAGQEREARAWPDGPGWREHLADQSGRRTRCAEDLDAEDRQDRRARS